MNKLGEPRKLGAITEYIVKDISEVDEEIKLEDGSFCIVNYYIEECGKGHGIGVSFTNLNEEGTFFKYTNKTKDLGVLKRVNKYLRKNNVHVWFKLEEEIPF